MSNCGRCRNGGHITAMRLRIAAFALDGPAITADKVIGCVNMGPRPIEFGVGPG
jgi:hypothetical protein